MSSHQHYLLIVLQLITVFDLINAVPIFLDVNGVSVDNETAIPDPVRINGSVTVLDSAIPSKTIVTLTSTSTSTPASISTSTSASTTESTTTVNVSRNARSDDESTINGLPSTRNESNKESSSERSSIIHFPQEDDIDLIINNSSSPKLSVVTEDATVSSDIAMESNSTINEGIIETSSSSSTTIDLSSPLTSSATPTSKPTSLILFSSTTTTTLKPPIDQVTSSSTPSSVPSTDATRIERSHSDLIADEINANLTETLLALTTLSSILNQTSTNDLPSTV